MGNTCGTCKFLKRRDNHFGWCLRYPPTLKPGAPENPNPSWQQEPYLEVCNDACGEYQPPGLDVSQAVKDPFADTRGFDIHNAGILKMYGIKSLGNGTFRIVMDVKVESEGAS